jgi:hypothetical protein
MQQQWRTLLPLFLLRMLEKRSTAAVTQACLPKAAI